MKALKKLLNWFLLGVLLISNSPLIYAQEIQNVIQQEQAQQQYRRAVEEAEKQSVRTDNANQNTSN